jgi:hypothetical protein
MTSSSPDTSPPSNPVEVPTGPPAKPRGPSASRSGCGVMIVIVGIIVLLQVWPMISAWSAVRRFENTAIEGGYTLVQGNGLSLVNDGPISEPTFFRAVDSVELHGGANADIAISSSDAVIDGTFTGNVAFLGKELTVLPGAVIMGDLEIAAAKYVTIRGEVVGEIRGEYRRLFRPQPSPPASAPGDLPANGDQEGSPAGG